MIRGVIFDLGSTLIRFRGKWSEVLAEGRSAMVAYLQQAGFALDGAAFAEDMQATFEANFRDRRQDHRERSTRSLVSEVLARQNSPEVTSAVLDEALRRLYAPSEACWSLIPGAGDVLNRLKQAGYRLGMISNASDEDNVLRLVDAAGLRHSFAPILISAAVGARKPTPSLFETVVRGWGIPPAEAVMVGDTLGEDILGAQRAGLHQIWVQAEADPIFNQEHMGVVIPERKAAELSDVVDVIASLDGRA
jgi:putative hydrolase of the HAD superfamily